MGRNREAIIQLKKNDRWRSATNIRDKVELSISEEHTRRIIGAAGLGKENIKRVKPIERFEADDPNDLWQTDIIRKIERLFGFVQKDFVPSVWKAETAYEVNGKFRVWLAQYNWKFKSRYFGGITRASRYELSERKAGKVELQSLLTVEERRKEVCL